MSKLPVDHPPIRGIKNGVVQESSSGIWKDVLRWASAAAAVLTVHAAGAYAIHAARQEPLPDGDPPAAIMIELDPVTQAPEVEQDAAAPMSEASINPDTAETEPEKPVEQTQEIKTEEPEEAPEEPQEIAKAEPVEEAVPDITEAEKPEVVLPKLVEIPRPKPEKPELKPEKPQHKPKPKEKARKTKKAKQKSQAAAPQVNAQNSSRVAASTNRRSSASAGISPARWQSKLQAHLERRKRAAQRAAGRGNKGIVRITFVIDPSGKVLSARASSGNPKLDQAAVNMVKKASPVPAPPDAIAQPRKTITVPIKFD